jgi:hypothetical protein
MASHWVGISQEDEQSLRQLADLLHLFHFRNKNQHRHSIWWRSFSTFRQQLNYLIKDISLTTDVPSTHLARVRKRSQDAKVCTRLLERTIFWQDVLLTKWQHTFSQLVADGRFTVLGVVLIASLAQVCAITGITADLEDLGQAEVEKVLEEFAKEDWNLGPQVKWSTEVEDLGQVVRREEAVRSVPNAGSHDTAHPNESQKSYGAAVETTTGHTLFAAKGKGHDRKRKRRDVIDDLFSDLF